MQFASIIFDFIEILFSTLYSIKTSICLQNILVSRDSKNINANKKKSYLSRMITPYPSKDNCSIGEPAEHRARKGCDER